MFNQGKQRRDGLTSRFKGVCRDKGRGIWMAYISVNRQRTYLGTFSDERAAAEAYNSAAVEAFGDFARLNPI